MPRTVVLSDIHGNLPALRSAWTDASRRKVDHVLFLGDLVAFGPHPVEVITYLRDVVKPQVAVRGNTDRYLVERTWESKDCSLPRWARESLAWTAERIGADGLEYLASLVDERDYEVDGVKVYLCHASPGDDEQGVTPDNAERFAEVFAPHTGKTVFCGHTHVPYRTRLGGASIINVGAIGMPFDRDQRASFLSFQCGDGELQELSPSRASYPIHDTLAALGASDMPGKEVVLHRLETASASVPRAYREDAAES